MIWLPFIWGRILLILPGFFLHIAPEVADTNDAVGIAKYHQSILRSYVSGDEWHVSATQSNSLISENHSSGH